MSKFLNCWSNVVFPTLIIDTWNVGCSLWAVSLPMGLLITQLRKSLFLQLLIYLKTSICSLLINALSFQLGCEHVESRIWLNPFVVPTRVRCVCRQFSFPYNSNCQLLILFYYCTWFFIVIHLKFVFKRTGYQHLSLTFTFAIWQSPKNSCWFIRTQWPWDAGFPPTLVARRKECSK